MRVQTLVVMHAAPFAPDDQDARYFAKRPSALAYSREATPAERARYKLPGQTKVYVRKIGPALDLLELIYLIPGRAEDDT